MNTTKTIERRKIRRRSSKLNDFLFELYEDIMPDFRNPGEERLRAAGKKKKSPNEGKPSGFDWGHFFPPNASGKTLVKMIKTKALLLE